MPLSPQPPVYSPSAETALADLRARYPETPFLALGQTALWDEPTKAVLRLALDGVWPEAKMLAGAHDTDYFAKLPGHPAGAGERKYAIVSHDDGRTRGLWSAAGEMSQLFGSEDVPTRRLLEEKAGVSVHNALRCADEADAAFSELTRAWGWTGIIHTEWGRKVTREIPLADILPILLEQISEAMNNSAQCLQGERQDHARTVAKTVHGWVEAFARGNENASLGDLYRDLLPRFYELLLGYASPQLTSTATTELLRFNRATAHLPRFSFVNLFLSPITRRKATNAYNLSLAGSDIYTTDRFGTGALPFDLVIPGKGRGTLTIEDDGTVTVDCAPNPVILCGGGCDLTNVERLAELVERELGTETTLVGKAVTLIPMLAAEFILVFHEGASGYSDRTRDMADRMRASRLPLPDLKTILRIRHSAWDALAETIACPAPNANEASADAFILPEFLAQAFGRETVSVDHFAACWRHATQNETARLSELATLTAPRDLLTYLARTLPNDDWNAKKREYDAARMRLLGIWDRAQAIQGRVYTLYDQVRAVKGEAADLEKRKGDDFRARVQPLRVRLASVGDAFGAPGEAGRLQAQIAALQAERAVTFDAEIASRRSQVRYALATVRELKEKRLQLEKGDEATTVRSVMRRIECEAEAAKAILARNALQTVNGLPHTSRRPSAWWFPLVDSSGEWFRRLAATADYYLEPLAP